MRASLWIIAFVGPLLAGELESARDRQDRAALGRIAQQQAEQARARPQDAEAQYHWAVAQSYVAEVAMQARDKAQARAAAEEGITAARKAVELKPNAAEYHRVLGTLCGQVIPANVLAGLKYGRCAQDEISRAIELDPKSALAHLSRGVGNYYLPPSFGGGIPLAMKDFERAIELDPKLAEAHLWLGVALREANRPADARQALERAVALNPQSAWAKQQLDKTPR